jgi:hypothetical protein
MNRLRDRVPSDTSPEAERILVDILRRMTPAEKWLRLGDIYRRAKLLHATGARSRDPSATPEKIRDHWTAITVGPPLSGKLSETAAMPPTDEGMQAVEQVVAVLVEFGIPYAVGGSVASSMFGEPRFTEDADISVEPFGGRESEFVARFGAEYYLSLSAIEDALRRRSCFNIIHLPSGFKVDIFVRQERAFEASVMSRRRLMPLASSPGRSLAVVSAEDIILLKLEWYRLGNETSDRQWRDVIGVLQVQARALDEDYLDRWAAELGVDDLMARARAEAGAAP